MSNVITFTLIFYKLIFAISCETDLLLLLNSSSILSIEPINFSFFLNTSYTFTEVEKILHFYTHSFYKNKIINYNKKETTYLPRQNYSKQSKFIIFKTFLDSY